MEGPSLYLAAEQLLVFKGKKIRAVSGNSKIGKERFLGKKVLDVFPWGKHLVFQFDNVAFRVHFLLFGTYVAIIDGKAVTGDYKRTREPRLKLEFDNGSVSMFNCSIKVFETDDLKATYDFSIDIMSPEWESRQALRAFKKFPQEEIGDVLLDQTVFAGVGNIIKNEVFSLVRVNPKLKVGLITPKKLKTLISVTHDFSYQFLAWRRLFVLRKNLKIHRRKYCPHCSIQVIREKTGKRQRWSYYCPQCQPRLDRGQPLL